MRSLIPFQQFHSKISFSLISFILLAIALSIVLGSCNTNPAPSSTPLDTAFKQTPLSETPTPNPTPEPPRLLSICMGSEPESLFLYGDGSVAARGVRQAIYDGPFDLLGYEVSPVILEEKPQLADQSARLESTQVVSGTRIIDAAGNLTNLKEGVSYYPSGCHEAACAATYSGNGPVSMDQLSVHFKLRAGIQW